MDLIKEIQKLENFIDKHDEAFMLHFFNMKPSDLLIGITGLYFGSNFIKVFYIVNDGTSIINVVSWNEFNIWKETIKND